MEQVFCICFCAGFFDCLVLGLVFFYYFWLLAWFFGERVVGFWVFSGFVLFGWFLGIFLQGVFLLACRKEEISAGENM